MMGINIAHSVRSVSKYRAQNTFVSLARVMAVNRKNTLGMSIYENSIGQLRCEDVKCKRSLGAIPNEMSITSS